MTTRDQNETLRLFKQALPFNDLAESEWQNLVENLQEHSFRKKDTIILDGEQSNQLFLVLQGECCLYKKNLAVKHYNKGDFFGELAFLNPDNRVGTIIAESDVVVMALHPMFLETAEHLQLQSKIYKGLAKHISSYLRDEDSLYRNIDVLIIQDGGCAPGYNPVTAFVSEYLEKSGQNVFVAANGFRSLVSNRSQDYRCLVYSKELYSQIEHIPGVVFSPPLREARGADFRSERFPQFKQQELQQIAAQNIQQRNVRVVIGIGGNGTFAGTKALSRFLGDEIQVFFIPVTIDSDVSGTECIGEYTGVEVGSEKIRCYMADARTHKRLYIIEMMGAKGGYHALHSCLGAGAHLAVLPNQDHDVEALVKAINNRDGTVIVVAEGYKSKHRKQVGYTGNAATFFRDELIAAGLNTTQKIVCEPFSRDIRGASPNNMDIMLAQRMARGVSQMVSNGETQKMPAVLSDREYSISFTDIVTDNSVTSSLAALANRLT